MQTKPKSNSVITHSVVSPGVLSFNVLGVGAITFDTSKVEQSNRERAMLHGFIQRISDRAAIGRNPDTGASATAQDKYNAMAALVAHYESGSAEWSTRVAGSTSGGLLFTCLRELYPTKSVEELRATIEKWSKSEQNAVLASAKVKPIADRIRAEAGKSVDVDSLLDELV